MKYTEQGDRVTLEMTRNNYLTLMLMMGFALGCIGRGPVADELMLRSWLKFANDLNTGNPNFTPYELPMGSDEGENMSEKNQRSADGHRSSEVQQ